MAKRVVRFKKHYSSSMAIHMSLIILYEGESITFLGISYLPLRSEPADQKSCNSILASALVLGRVAAQQFSAERLDRLNYHIAQLPTFPFHHKEGCRSARGFRKVTICPLYIPSYFTTGGNKRLMRLLWTRPSRQEPEERTMETARRSVNQSINRLHSKVATDSKFDGGKMQ